MNDTIRNAIAVFRGNFVCGINRLRGRCNYINLIRIFKGTEIRISKKGKLTLGKGVAIGERCLCTVRSGAEIKIGDMSNLNSDCKMVSHKKIEIGHDTIFGPNVLIYDHDHVYDSKTGVRRKEYKTSEIVIGNNCWIGAGSIILRGTHIGDNCLVGAGSIVKGNYPSGMKIIQKRGGGCNEDIYSYRC